jgi:hypothetical protein
MRIIIAGARPAPEFVFWKTSGVERGWSAAFSALASTADWFTEESDDTPPLTPASLVVTGGDAAIVG